MAVVGVVVGWRRPPSLAGAGSSITTYPVGGVVVGVVVVGADGSFPFVALLLHCCKIFWDDRCRVMESAGTLLYVVEQVGITYHTYDGRLD